MVNSPFISADSDRAYPGTRLFQITPEIEPFYRSALLALRALEAGGARGPSFGPDPDARWKAFRGELRDADRLDLLIRNALSPDDIAPDLSAPTKE